MHCLARIEQASSLPLPLINYDLYLLSSRFANLHDFGSEISYPKSRIGYLIEDKGRKQNLFLEYVEESFVLFPHATEALLATPEDWSADINSHYGYVNLHLLQYNANGQRSDDSVFALFRKVNQRLVKLGFSDLDDYYNTEDYYTTAVKHRPSGYGWKMGRGNFSEEIVIDHTTTENRSRNYLLPFSMIKH